MNYTRSPLQPSLGSVQVCLQLLSSKDLLLLHGTLHVGTPREERESSGARLALGLESDESCGSLFFECHRHLSATRLQLGASHTEVSLPPSLILQTLCVLVENLVL